ncbi:adenosylcobinamide-phosphate synthase CbiB [Geobacter sp. AOG2]|uniref:adenosylcobinamide-phosphate synthase CbiB n=1 Tax=Geobacter sp. AOG2 TaxID=1566347 RepID=UPI001CC542D7|nr:adenosylcobinamide-phosphate synthase CbiB [Geobacter sp. AOG2]GFE60283.1 cobalamin biosynthesis protein CobD [Geobacter sp. AOG2]
MTSAEPAVLILALVLDLTLGDPRRLPHPVVLIGRLIALLESGLRRITRHERAAGIGLLLLTVGTSAATTWLAVYGLTTLNAFAGFLGAAYISYTCLAARSLHRESALVADALAAGNRDEARRNLSYIVGRDTRDLGDADIWRALVETVAENTADGIVSPLFWLTLGGPVAGMAFKAVSTLDSMVGYQNERYLRMGWASARMDDLLNFIPARLTALLMVMAAPLAGLSGRNAARIALRDRRNHPSPNSGHPEAAAAGALGVRLGGAASYGGRPSWKEHIGDPLAPLDGRAYRSMIRLMYATTLLMAAVCIAAAWALKGFHVPQP